MITVSILINGQPIATRSARNTGEKDKDGKTVYVVDDGGRVLHKRDEGAIKLAKMLLDRITEL